MTAMLRQWLPLLSSLLILLLPFGALAGKSDDKPPDNSFTAYHLLGKKAGDTAYYTFGITNNKDQSACYCQGIFGPDKPSQQRADCGSNDTLVNVRQPASGDPHDGFGITVLWSINANQPSGKVDFAGGLKDFINCGGKNTGISSWFKATTNFNYGKY